MRFFSLLVLLSQISAPGAEAGIFDFCRTKLVEIAQRSRAVAQSKLSDADIERILQLRDLPFYRIYLATQGATAFSNKEVARAAVQHLANSNLSAIEKAALWERISLFIQGRGVFFSSTYHQGSDGSFVFQGGDYSTILVITTDGRVFRGNLKKGMVTGDIWPADYSALRIIAPLAAP
jgi:hypothetical protein